MLALGMKDDDDKYRKIEDADTAPFAVTHYEKRAGDSRKTPSWLWKNSGYLDTLPEGQMKNYVLESEFCIAFGSAMLMERNRASSPLVQDSMRMRAMG